MAENTGRFEVTGHFELAERGGFVIGRIVEGKLCPGMLAPTGLRPTHLKVQGVEFVDIISARNHHNALLFAEKPALNFVMEAFPVGTVIQLRDAFES